MNRIAGGCALALTLVSAHASAQDGAELSAEEAAEIQQARALFEEGLELSDRGEWERAVSRFRSALELRESPRVRTNLAISLARMGRLVEANEEAARVLATPDLEDEVAREASLLTEEIAPRLGALQVDVDGELGDAHVTVDGRPWTILGQPAPADPGMRVVRLVEGDTELDIEEAEVIAQQLARVLLARPVAAAEAESDDTWIWATVIGVSIVAVGAAVVTGVVLAQP